MKTKHTPAPWYVTFLDNEVCAIEHDEREAIIATINDAPESNRTIETNKANARLIAAAPELLEANVVLLEWYRFLVAGNTKKISVYRMERFTNMAKQAIKKAKEE